MAGQGSARVTLKEIDLSQVNNPQQQPQGVPAAVVGPARKGPAFVPRTFANIQQFSDTFGDMLEVSKDSNSNLFGPLALDQWLRNANAGTYIRTLGVGDGSKNAVGAGFVVGSKQILKSSNKVADNEHAVGTELGKTMALGCFMSDSSNSKYLQDAGVQTNNASGSLKIDFTDPPLNSDTLTLVGLDASGNSKTWVITFVAANNDHVFGDGSISVGVNGLDGDQTATALFNALNGNNQAGQPQNPDPSPATYFTTTNPALGVVNIVQVGTGVATNTTASFNINATAELTNGTDTKQNSEASQTVATTASGATVSVSTITVTGNPADNDGFRITDELGNVSNIVLDIDNDAAANNNAGTVTVGISTPVADSDNNAIAAAIRSAITASIAANNHDDDGAVATISVDAANDNVVTIRSVLKGNVTLISNETDTNEVLGLANNAGSDGTPSSVTLTFSGLPAVNNEFTLDTVNEANNASLAKTFRFIANANGASNGQDVGAGVIGIELPTDDNLDILLSNIQNAIETVQPAFYVVSINAANDSVTITNEKVQGFVQDRNFDFKINQNVSVQEDGAAVAGRFGPQTIDFAGGGGGASPIIRGLLMLPQGVRASLDQQRGHASGDFNKLSDISESVLRTININGKNFSDASQDDGVLAGYQIGEVNNQGFSILLNGFSNSNEPAVLDCSFNPADSTYFANVLNTDPTKIKEKGHYLHVYWDVESAVSAPSNAGLTLDAGGPVSGSGDSNMIGFLIQAKANIGSKFEEFNSRYQTAKTPWIVSQFFSKPSSTSRQSGSAGLTLATGEAKKLFRLHALDDGAVGNNQLRVLISGIRSGRAGTYGSFDMFLELFDGDAVDGTVVAGWKNLTFDPDSMNYIERVIGNQHTYYNFADEENRQRLVVEGNFEVRNRFVRVEVSEDILNGSCPISALPAGFRGPSHLKTLNSFAEFGDDGSGNNRILSSDALDDMQVAPLPFVKTISRKLKVTGSDRWEADSSLAWGIKFASRENADLSFQENAELKHNKSLASWTKYLPAAISESDSSGADSFQNNFFSLEKIAVKRNGDVIDWNLSKYSRDGSLPSGGSGLMTLDSFVDFEKDANTANLRYLKFRCLFQGGFDGLNIFDEDKYNQNNTAAYREANSENNDNAVTGPTIMAYRKALDVLTDKSAVELQLLAIPGIREPQVTNYAIKACEDRFDAMFVMDIQQIDEDGEEILYDSVKPHVRKTIATFEKRVLDTSFAAAYFPNVLVRRPSTGAPIEVPPSVCMLGVMSQNDSVADPWFAPAGLNRGRLNALNSNLQMNRDLLDELYDVDINPIYEPSGRSGEVYAFGQKTLLQDQSALDRINVRRLLIDLRRKVKNVAQTLLFEPNRASTLQRFNALVEPILANVQARQGVERYKVQIDSNTTTQNDIENNTIRGKIYLQPTKSVEFISLDFVVTNSID